MNGISRRISSSRTGHVCKRVGSNSKRLATSCIWCSRNPTTCFISLTCPPCHRHHLCHSDTVLVPQISPRTSCRSKTQTCYTASCWDAHREREVTQTRDWTPGSSWGLVAHSNCVIQVFKALTAVIHHVGVGCKISELMLFSIVDLKSDQVDCRLYHGVHISIF
jgi:hypothetical protein